MKSLANVRPSGTDLSASPATDGGLVYFVDDEESVRRGVARLLSSAGIRNKCVASATEFLQEESAQGPACLLLDLRLPDMSGLELQERLLDSGRALPIVFISGHGDVPTSAQAFKHGAVDFLIKPFDDSELLAALASALAAARAAEARREDLASLEARFNSLTPRERQVFDLVARGLLNKQIGGWLGTREKTIKAQRAQVMAKMKAASLADLVRMAEKLHASLGRESS